MRIHLGRNKNRGKTNEIKAILELLETIKVKCNVVTIDAIGTQTEIAPKIIEKGANYVPSVKENQKCLYQEVSEYMNDETLKNALIINAQLKRVMVRQKYESIIKQVI